LTMSSTDWEHREFIQNVQYNIMKVASFLNQFDISTRIRLAQLNSKLQGLERQMEYLESSIKHVSALGAGGKGSAKAAS